MENALREYINKTLTELGIGEADFTLEHPADLAHGDFASNVAMVVAQRSGEVPAELAGKICAALEGKIEHIEKTEIAGPGFINFTLARDFFTIQTQNILKSAEKWGRNDLYRGKKIMVEYTDPNPFKELHIGHLVPNALGESLAHIFEYSGAEVRRVTFQGDVGMHVAKAVYGLKSLGIEADAPLDPSMLGVSYATGAKAFEESKEAKEEIIRLNTVIYERSDENINALYEKGKAVSLEYFEVAYKKLGSVYDHYFFESETGSVGLKLVKEHTGDIFSESEGAIIFKGEEYGLHTRVFVNKEGLPTYEAKDVGLFVLKQEYWPFDVSVTVTGSEQQTYFEVVRKAIELLMPDATDKILLVPNGMLRLADGKMSSRTGDVIPALSFIDDVQNAVTEVMKDSELREKDKVAEMVAIGAIRYSILKSAAGKDIVFDKERALSFEGDSGPYLQYTHARACSVIEKAKNVGVGDFGETTPHEPYALERMLYRFPDVIARAATEREPHYVVTYLTELAASFNSFYAQEKIADTDDEYAPYKVVLTDAVRLTLKNGLEVLGIKAPERM